MPSNTRWALNPRKWFGTAVYTNNKQDKNQSSLPRVPTTATTTRTTSLANPSHPPLRHKGKIAPVPVSNDVNKNPTTTTSTVVTQLQLPAFTIRRERTSTLLPSTTSFSRNNTFVYNHTEPSIRKYARLEEQLAIDTTRLNSQTTPPTTNLEPIKNVFSPENDNINQTRNNAANMSRNCLVNYPRYSAHITKESSSPARSSSASSMFDDNSSSSGIYTDERQCTESKDTLSNVEILSVESIQDSGTLLNRPRMRPMIHHYRRPMSEISDGKPQQQQNYLTLSNRSQSAEDILKDNPRTARVITAKSRQSSAAIVKKIEKRITTNRSPTNTLEKTGFVRIRNDAYRLTPDEEINQQLPGRRKKSMDTFIPYSNYDDPLPSANNEECYALLPRTTSTEQLHSNMQQDVRIIVNECIRPIMTSIGKNRFVKNQNQRFKRSNINNDYTQFNLENITDKLLSSVDCSTYTRYKRCY